MANKKDNKKNNDKSKKSKSKKKRKVGRPKKRGRKKKYYKKKGKRKKKKSTSTRGFGSNVSYNRVRSLLWQNYKEDFTSYIEFISNDKDEQGNKIKGTSIVSKVYDQCKSVDCSDEDILSIYRQFKTQDKGDPAVLPDAYFDPRPYYELLTENLWDGMDERLWVYSPMLLPPPSIFLGILGEDRCIDKDNQIKDITDCDKDKGDRLVEGKKEYFTAFVNYCNQFQQSGIYEGSDEVPHVKFKGEGDEREPYWNEEEGRWEVEIVPCTPFGEVYDYGFDPDSTDQMIPDEDDLIEIKEKEDEEEEEQKVEKDTEKEIALEKEKQKTLAQAEKTAQAQAKLEEKKIIADITAQWRRGDITKKEMMELIKIIKE